MRFIGIEDLMKIFELTKPKPGFIPAIVLAESGHISKEPQSLGGFLRSKRLMNSPSSLHQETDEETVLLCTF